MCRDYNPYSDSDSDSDSFSRRHSAVKVTMTFEGSPDEIREVMHGAAEDAGSARKELAQKVQENLDLRDKLWSTEQDLKTAKERADSRDHWHKLACQESDKVYALNSRVRELERQLNASNEANGKLRSALAAATGQSVESVSVVYPTRSSFLGNSESPNYPYALLVGDRETVKKQVLDCFVDDSRRENKIQAIKMMRERSGLGLREAKDLIEWAIDCGQFAHR